MELSQEQITFFRQNGFVRLDAITTQEEIIRLRAIYDRLFEQKSGRNEGQQFDLAGTDEDDKEAKLPQILSPSTYAPELKDSLYHRNALTVAQQLLGPTAAYTGEHAILKPPRIGAETPWHQDEAYWNPGQYHESISIWMPLQEATLENGCMQFIPMDTAGDVLPHHSINHDPRIHGLEMDTVDASQAVACPIPAGGATIHHCRIPHYAGPNRSDTPRRAYILVFGLPTEARETARDFHWQRERQTARQERHRNAQMKN